MVHSCSFVHLFGSQVCFKIEGSQSSPWPAESLYKKIEEEWMYMILQKNTPRAITRQFRSSPSQSRVLFGLCVSVFVSSGGGRNACGTVGDLRPCSWMSCASWWATGLRLSLWRRRTKWTKMPTSTMLGPWEWGPWSCDNIWTGARRPTLAYKHYIDPFRDLTVKHFIIFYQCKIFYQCICLTIYRIVWIYGNLV